MKKILGFLLCSFPAFLMGQNVGINTNSPASTLTINGTNPDIGIMNNGMAHAFMRAGAADFTIGTSSDNPVGKLIFGTKDNNHLNIDPLGRISIGTNSNYDAEFKLNGNGSVRFALMHQNIARAFLALNAGDLRIGTFSAGSHIVLSPKGVDKVWVDEDGNVGIGTASPVSELTINGVNPYLEFQNSGVNTGFIQASGIDLKLGTNSTNLNGSLVFQTKLINRMTIDENGRIGIGTNPTSYLITVDADDPMMQFRDEGEDRGFIQVAHTDIKIGTNASNTYGNVITRTGGQDRIYVTSFGQMGINMLPTAFFPTLSIAPDENGNTGVALVENGSTKGLFTFNGTNTFITSSVGSMVLYRSSTSPFVAHADGGFSLGGWEKATGYKLSVNGKTISTDFVTLPINNWPDYVFSDDYQLRPISDLKKFITTNKHLPNIPSAEEIGKNGIQLGDMSKRLMEKVEELTLYIIQLQDQVNELKKQNNASTLNK